MRIFPVFESEKEVVLSYLSSKLSEAIEIWYAEPTIWYLEISTFQSYCTTPPPPKPKPRKDLFLVGFSH